MTYGRRGVVDRYDAKHHAIAYIQGTTVAAIDGEEMDRLPIPIQPKISGGSFEPLDPASRVNFSKCYTIEHNVKVKPIGRVTDEWMAWVKSYWRQSMGVD
jgi:hypothetical protein